MDLGSGLFVFGCTHDTAGTILKLAYAEHVEFQGLSFDCGLWVWPSSWVH